MTTNLMWPEWLLRPTKPTPVHVVPMNTSGGRSGTGSEQVVGNSPGHSRVEMKEISVKTIEEVRLWNVLALNLRGRANVLMAPTFARRIAPWPIVAGATQRSLLSVTFSDTILFSNGATLYTPVISAAAASGGALEGETDLDITLTSGSALKAGHVFQHSEYAYPIRKVVGVVGSVYSIISALPFREDIANAAALNFDDPRFRAKLEEDDSMPAEMDLWRFANQSVAFVEDF